MGKKSYIKAFENLTILQYLDRDLHIKEIMATTIQPLKIRSFVRLEPGSG